MKVQAINNNSNSFGAKIKIQDPTVLKLVPYKGTSSTLEILNRFDAYKPEQIVEIGLNKVKDFNYLSATNLSTNTSYKIPIFPELFEDLRMCSQLYDMLAHLLHKETKFFDEFWGNTTNDKIPVQESYTHKETTVPAKQLLDHPVFKWDNK